jgi:hypothetical protein
MPRHVSANVEKIVKMDSADQRGPHTPLGETTSGPLVNISPTIVSIRKFHIVELHFSRWYTTDRWWCQLVFYFSF